MIGSSWTPLRVNCCAAPTQGVSSDLTNLDIIQPRRHRKFLEDVADRIWLHVPRNRMAAIDGPQQWTPHDFCRLPPALDDHHCRFGKMGDAAVPYGSFFARRTRIESVPW